MLDLTTFLIVIPIVLLMAILVVITNKKNKKKIKWKQADIWLETGDFIKLKKWAREVKDKNVPASKEWKKADSLEQKAKSIEQDFSLMEDVVVGQLKEKMGQYSQSERYSWEKNGLLPYKVIDGEKRYFKNGVSDVNMSLLKGGKELGVLSKNPMGHGKGMVS
ncbi:hypothetical protein [Saccharicrinis fermentans]|uniref:Uncharacterized protein n=1 Tax=Saccharicrinis fermentans DSM 9555 = JCM 21142 TaxID=869213 RepID=W7YIT6_9BACT|nr:hypothetical protein [Saccharicrinis fermentans]GAF04386.1 hypothetical protein JCM21142_83088 [Saccharicrinis fermentans DSM 9555 = JCM 21142]